MFKWVIIGMMVTAGAIAAFMFFREHSKKIPAADEVVDDAKGFVEGETDKAKSDIADFLAEKARDTFEGVLGKSDEKPKVSVIDQKSQAVEKDYQVTIDFSQNSGLKLSFEKNKKYYLTFKNVPNNYCLYVSEAKYVIDPAKMIEIIFSSNGTFPLRANKCDLEYKELGEVSVN